MRCGFILRENEQISKILHDGVPILHDNILHKNIELQDFLLHTKLYRHFTTTKYITQHAKSLQIFTLLTFRYLKS